MTVASDFHRISPQNGCSPFGSFEGSRFFFGVILLYAQMKKSQELSQIFARFFFEKIFFLKNFVEIAGGAAFAHKIFKPVENSVETV